MFRIFLLCVLSVVICAAVNILSGGSAKEAVNTMEYWIQAMVLFVIAFLIIFAIEVLT